MYLMHTSTGYDSHSGYTTPTECGRNTRSTRQGTGRLINLIVCYVFNAHLNRSMADKVPTVNGRNTKSTEQGRNK